MNVRWTAIAATIAACGAFPSAAPAASVAVETGGIPAGASVDRLVFAAAGGEANRVSIAGADGGALRVEDAGAALEPGRGCEPAADGRGAICRPSRPRPVGGPPSFYGIVVTLGDGDDAVSVHDAGAARLDEDTGTLLSGGAGDDRIEPGPFGRHAPGDTQRPERPNVAGGEGDDALLGGPSDDLIDGGPGADVIRGGDGGDGVTGYEDAAGISVSLDDRPGDGRPGENDDVGSDVEAVTGSAGGDRLVGSGGANVLLGGAGDDVLAGLGGADRLDGGAGNDVLEGGDGDDLLVSGGGDGRVGFEHDVAIGGPGPDRFDADSATIVHALDGERDSARCGGEVVFSSADPFDSLRFCAPAVFGPSDPVLRVRRDRTVGILLKCQGGTDIPCIGTLVLRRSEPDEAVVGRARYRLPRSRRPRRVRVLLSRAFVGELDALEEDFVVAHYTSRRAVPRSARAGAFELKLLAPR